MKAATEAERPPMVALSGSNPRMGDAPKGRPVNCDFGESPPLVFNIIKGEFKMAYHFETHEEAEAWLKENKFKLIKHFMGNDTWERKIGRMTVVFDVSLTQVNVIANEKHVIYSGFKNAIGTIKDFLFDALCEVEDIMHGCQEMSDSLNAEYWPQRIEKE